MNYEKEKAKLEEMITSNEMSPPAGKLEMLGFVSQPLFTAV